LDYAELCVLEQEEKSNSRALLSSLAKLEAKTAKATKGMQRVIAKLSVNITDEI